MSLVRSFSIYTVSSVISAAVPVLLLPVLTHYLSEADYGAAATLQTLIAFTTPLLMFGIPAAIAVDFSKLESARRLVFISTLLRVPMLTSVLLLIAGVFASALFAEKLGIPHVWMAITPCFALLTLFPVVLSAVLRMQENAFGFAYVELGSAILSVGLSLLMVVVFQLQWEGRMYGIAVTGLVMSVVSVAWLKRLRLLGLGFDRHMFVESLKFGMGLVPHDLGNQIVRMSDRLILAAMLGLASAGQYAVAAQIASAMLILLASFNRAWMPFLVSRLSSDSTAARISIVRMSYVVIAGFFLFFVIFNLATPLIYKLFINNKFHDSMRYVFWLTLGYLFLSVYLTYVDYIFLVKKTHLLSLVTGFNIMINIALNLLLIERYGAIGAAMAFAGTMFFVMVVTFIISNRIHPMPWFYWLGRSQV